MASAKDEPVRLGKRALGPHAHEERMPEHILAAIAREGDESDLRGVIFQLADWLEGDAHVQHVYLCHEQAVQVHKQTHEGNHFCGYRNLQMLCYALGFSGICPALRSRRNILEIQDMIEQAWDQGINAHARTQTGGIKNSRKHIGTSEAEAVLQSLGVQCTGNAFAGSNAWHQLLDFVEQAFAHASLQDQTTTVCKTRLMPIFLQRPQHSLTIVGLVKMRNGRRELLVFDPALPPALSSRLKLKSAWLQRWSRKVDMAVYRRGERYLKHYSAFETLSIDVLATKTTDGQPRSE